MLSPNDIKNSTRSSNDNSRRSSSRSAVTLALLTSNAGFFSVTTSPKSEPKSFQVDIADSAAGERYFLTCSCKASSVILKLKTQRLSGHTSYSRLVLGHKVELEWKNVHRGCWCPPEDAVEKVSSIQNMVEVTWEMP
eukprot:284814617_5